MRRSLFFLILCISTLSVVRGQAVTVEPVQPRVHAAAIGERSFPPPARIADFNPSQSIVLAPTSPAEVPPTRSGGPIIVGTVRALGEGACVLRTGGPFVESAVSRSASNVVGARIKVPGAARLRLHVVLSRPINQNTIMWVYAPGEPDHAFDASLVDPDGSLWTPSVAGDTVCFEISATSALTATVKDVVVIPAALSPNSVDACAIDAMCVSESVFPGITLIRSAIADLFFPVAGGYGRCTGALVIDRQGTFTPYLLTANHCISDQATASSLEAFWDEHTASCQGAVPVNFPESTGGTLVVTSAFTDVALLKLNSVPAGRAFLGWDPRPSAIVQGTVVGRISHPATDNGGRFVQAYSTSIIDETSPSCVDSPRPQFVYSKPISAGVTHGSSGSPALLPGGFIVGQLKRACGLGPDCPPTGLEVADGSFAQSYVLLSPFLEDSNTGPLSCTPSATTACVLNNRFQVRVRVHNHFANPQYDFDAFVKPVTGFASAQSETAFFHFGDANNIELLVKLLKAGDPGIAVLYGVATPYENLDDDHRYENGGVQDVPHRPRCYERADTVGGVSARGS